MNSLMRKFLIVCVVSSLVLIGFGFALAGDREPAHMPGDSEALPSETLSSELPEQPTAPMQVPPPREANKTNGKAELDLEQKIKEVQRGLKPCELLVLIEATCIHAEAGFCQECGLTSVDAGNTQFGTALSSRELKLLTALLRAKPNWQIYTRPTVVVAEGNTKELESVGYIRKHINNHFETTSTWRTTFRLLINPKISKDNGYVRLALESLTTQWCSIVKSEDSVKHITNKKDVFKTEVVIQSAGTALVGVPNVEIEPANENLKKDVLWILTPHIIRGKP